MGWFIALPEWLKQLIGATLIAVVMLVGFKVWLIRHDSAVLAGYVKQSELDTANTLLLKAKNDSKFNADRADALRKQVDNATVAAQLSEKKYEDAVKNDTADDGGTVSHADVDWLQHNR